MGDSFTPTVRTEFCPVCGEKVEGEYVSFYHLDPGVTVKKNNGTYTYFRNLEWQFKVHDACRMRLFGLEEDENVC